MTKPRDIVLAQIRHQECVEVPSRVQSSDKKGSKINAVTKHIKGAGIMNRVGIRKSFRAAMLVATAYIALLFTTPAAQASAITWILNGNGNWNTTTANWPVANYVGGKPCTHLYRHRCLAIHAEEVYRRHRTVADENPPRSSAFGRDRR